jgi:DNA-binding PadR family transcriptional regulator
MRLGDQGLLEARWSESDQPGKPPRHLYRPTAAGLALAREQRAFANDGGLPFKSGA